MTALLSWIPDDRPRERMASRGAGALSDAELVAIF
jgi:DNA repair protein RadC